MQRQSSINRETRETKLAVFIDLDGTGNHEITTGNGMLDHLIAQLSRHSLIDITLTAQGDLNTGWHHLVEDTAITLGKALRDALGDGTGIVRMGHAIVPLDETLALVALDLSGRGYAVIDPSLSNDQVETLSGDLVRHFLESFALESKIALHANLMCGLNPHHKAEALFKALAKALRQAVAIDPRSSSEIPSTKGTIQD